MVMVRVNTNTTRIPLGRQGENLARKIQFNISDWRTMFGPGKVALIHKRNGDEVAYPVELRAEEAAAYWDVKRADVEIAGNGKCELSYYVNDVIAKSVTYTTVVQASMNDEIGYEPSALPNWVDTIYAAVAESEKAAQAATEAAEAANEAAEAANEAAENAGSTELPDNPIASDREVNEMLDEVFGEGPSPENS